MSMDIGKLEQDWLQAETIADRARHDALQADAVITQRRGADGEVKVLLSAAEELRARHEAAERQASELFDRLWQAKECGQVHAYDR